MRRGAISIVLLSVIVTLAGTAALAFLFMSRAKDAQHNTPPLARAPFIKALEPTSGAVGSEVMITGTDFTPTGNAVRFGAGFVHDLNSAGGTILKFRVPDGLDLCSPQATVNNQPCPEAFPKVQAGDYPISVITSHGESNQILFRVVEEQKPQPRPISIKSKDGEWPQYDFMLTYESGTATLAGTLSRSTPCINWKLEASAKNGSVEFRATSKSTADMCIEMLGSPQQVSASIAADDDSTYKIYINAKQVFSGTFAHDAGKAIVRGKVTIGPICPVERIDRPCLPPPDAYTSRRVAVYREDLTVVASMAFNTDGTYSFELDPGTYYLDLIKTGIDYSKELPRKFTVKAGETFIVDFSVVTGIR